MSNARAIAVVTAALASILTSVARTVLSGTVIHVGRPEKLPEPDRDQPGINVFLFQVSINDTLRNVDLPMRMADGRLVQRPTLGLDLIYLLTFHGPGLVPELLLGRTLSALHARPALSPELVANAIQQKGNVPGDRYLQETDIDQAKGIRFESYPLSLEELSKLWSVFFQMPYALSLAYRATAVMVEAEDLPVPALPVRDIGARSGAGGIPQIEQILPLLVEPDTPIVLRGRNLSAADTWIQFSGSATPVAPQATADGLQVTLPNDLAAGATSASLVDATGRPLSNAAPFMLHPRVISADVANRLLTVNLVPQVQAGQRVRLLLNMVGSREAYTIDVPNVTQSTGQIAIPVPALQSGGSYLVRVQVNGAESQLTTVPPPDKPHSPAQPYNFPMVTLP